MDAGTAFQSRTPGARPGRTEAGAIESTHATPGRSTDEPLALSWAVRVPSAEVAAAVLAGGRALGRLVRRAGAAFGAREIETALAAALRDQAPRAAEVSRLYFGAEFCEHLIPSPREMECALDLAARAGLDFTLLTPPVTDGGLHRLAPLLRRLEATGLDTVEVVASDWGVLARLRSAHPRLRGVLGRVLTPTLRDPRLAHRLLQCPDVPEPAWRAYRGTSLSNPDYRHLLDALGVERVELDNLVHGTAPDPGDAGLRASLHIPYGIVARGRICVIGSYDLEPGRKFSLDPCARRCRDLWIDRGRVGGGETRLVEFGNAVLYAQGPKTIADGLTRAPRCGVDRCVITVGSPQGGAGAALSFAPLARSRRPRVRGEVTPGTRGRGLPRIAAPLGRAEEAEMLIGAGADELYVGLVPPGWRERFTDAAWTNRRSPGGGNLLSYDDLASVEAVARGHRVPLALTLNAPHYAGAHLEAAIAMAERAVEIGVSALIVADPGLIATLVRRRVAAELRLSSIGGVHNRAAARFFVELGVRRIILPRHVRLAEVRSLRRSLPDAEIEVFIMNDQCPFEEGHCFTQHHAAGLPVFCHDPMALVPIAAASGGPLSGAAQADWQDHLRDRRQWLEACAGCRGRLGPTGAPLGTCGLCALPFLCEIGVDAVKVVGREAAAYTKLRSVQLVRRVLEEVQAGAAPAECAALACTLRGTPEMCARGFSCYYRDLPEGARSSLHSERPLPVRD